MNHEKHEKKNPRMDTNKHELISDIREIISQARSLTRRSVNSLQVISNYLIGMRIVLEEQKGQTRAEYGKETMKLLSKELTDEFGRGYSRRNIELMRKFYLSYSPTVEQKTQTLSAFFDKHQISQTVSDQSSLEKSQTLSWKLDVTQIIDLKIGELKHQDLGQMQMYVNYFDRYVKLEDEQPTIGIVLCKKKKDSLVEITLPEGTNIHATKYQTYLPDKEALKKQLEEAQAEWEAREL